MKKITFTLLAIALIATSCAKKDATPEEQMAADTIAKEAENNSAVAERDTVVQAATANAAVKPDGKELTVKGTVTEIMPGKDGYTAKLKADDGKVYMAIISIPNMEKEYKQVKAGENITVTGEAYTIEEDITIKVKKIQ